jgi:hypothetical protein
MLVHGGRPVIGIGGKDLVARTFIATDGGEKWVIGYCPRATLEDLADALVAPEVVHEFRIMSALNLDGGPSSGIWWKPKSGEPRGIRDKTRVRNAIVILPGK